MDQLTTLVACGASLKTSCEVHAWCKSS